MRSNMFSSIEDKFKNASEEEITQVGIVSLQQIIDALSGFEVSAIFCIALIGAKLGVAGDGKINKKEKKLIDKVFCSRSNGNSEAIYSFFDNGIKEEDYNIVKETLKLGNSFAIPFLNLILSFAYIDGVFEDDVAQRLDGLFGINLAALFMQTGLEEVPQAESKLSDLEEEIVQWLESEDSLRPLNDFLVHFSDRTKKEVKAALKNLCSQGILYCADTVAGDMYGLT